MPWWWGYTETVSPRPPRLHRISTGKRSRSPRKSGPRSFSGISERRITAPAIEDNALGHRVAAFARTGKGVFLSGIPPRFSTASTHFAVLLGAIEGN